MIPRGFTCLTILCYNSRRVFNTTFNIFAVLKAAPMNTSKQEELWRPVKGFERYHVSSFGQVKNYKTGRILKPYEKHGGYMAVTIVKSVGVRSTFLVHRLVALTFLGQGEPGSTVDHIDRDTRNNVLTNLRWATPTQQHTANRKRRKTGGIEGGRPVWKCDQETGQKIELFRNLKLAAESTESNSVNPKSMICAAARGRTKSAFGFKWIYDDDEVIEGEVWKPLEPDLVRGQVGYFISSEGRVKNRKGRINRSFGGSNGYSQHCIHPHVFAAHRLVAFAFLEGVPGKNVVNHKDGDKTNCRVSNLEFVTQKENVQHAVDTGLSGKEMGVTQYSLSGEFIKDHHSAASAGREFGVGRTSIRQSIRPGGTCMGFQFRATKNNTIPIGVVEDRRYINCVSQFTLSEQFVDEFKDASQAGRSLNTSKQDSTLSMGIKRACARNGGVYLGYRWYKTNEICD